MNFNFYSLKSMLLILPIFFASFITMLFVTDYNAKEHQTDKEKIAQLQYALKVFNDKTDEGAIKREGGTNGNFEATPLNKNSNQLATNQPQNTLQAKPKNNEALSSEELSYKELYEREVRKNELLIKSFNLTNKDKDASQKLQNNASFTDSTLTQNNPKSTDSTTINTQANNQHTSNNLEELFQKHTDSPEAKRLNKLTIYQDSFYLFHVDCVKNVKAICYANTQNQIFYKNVNTLYQTIIKDINLKNPNIIKLLPKLKLIGLDLHKKAYWDDYRSANKAYLQSKTLIYTKLLNLLSMKMKQEEFFALKSLLESKNQVINKIKGNLLVSDQVFVQPFEGEIINLKILLVLLIINEYYKEIL